MQDNIRNRQTAPSARKVGRPSLAEIAARNEPEVPAAAPVKTADGMIVMGFTATCCGVAQNPRVYSTVGLTRYCLCGHCGRRMKLLYRENGTRETVIYLR